MIETYDVVIAGSGPAGLSAAVTASRMGCSVALLERNGIIGGNLTSGYVGPVMGSVSSGSIREEILELSGSQQDDLYYDCEQMKISLIEWLAETSVDVYLLSTLISAQKQGSSLTQVQIVTPGGLIQLAGKVFIDATGDGTLAALAGAAWQQGREADGLTQPATLMFTLDHIDPAVSLQCRHEEDDSLINGTSYLGLCRQAERDGRLPANVSIVRLYRTVNPGERMVNATQANFVNGLDPRALAPAQVNLRRQMRQVHQFLKDTVPGFESSRIRSSSDGIGIRETRRIEGDYILTAEDLLQGRQFEDAIVHQASFPLDIHNPNGGGQAESEGCPPKAQPYDIPYRALLPRGIEQLLLAGRCISGTHRAHASYRVMGICMATGQAAGAAAALCARSAVSPRNLDVRLLRTALAQQGVCLD